MSASDRSLLVTAAVVAALASAMGLFDLASNLTALTFALIGALIAVQGPHHPIGWLLLFVAFTQGVVEAAGVYTNRGFDVELAKSGAGLSNVRDRLDALDGDRKIVSAPGHGAHVLGRLPLLTPAMVG